MKIWASGRGKNGLFVISKTEIFYAGTKIRSGLLKRNYIKTHSL